jgi:four helix bundle protein
MDHILNHERLDAYRLALQVARWIRTTRFPSGDSNLRDQAKRAADSVVLNVAEGCGRSGGDRRRHFTIAAASAAECCAVLDLVDLPEGAVRQAELRRIVAMASRLR